MKIERYVVLCLLLGVSSLTTGCISKSWEPSWWLAKEPRPSEKSKNLLEKARKAFAEAGDKKKLLASMDAYRAVLDEDPGNKEALAYLGNQYILLGTAYTDDKDRKKECFRLAMRFCELAMYTNPRFKDAVDGGKKPWEAADALETDDTTAMLFWVTALQYEFKEGMSLPGKFVNIGWLQHCLPFLDRIKAVDPAFGHGAVEFAYTICYCALPSFKGGDKEKGMAFMNKAVELSDGYLLSRWGRGKYYHQVTGDKETSRKDLRWVLDQDPNNFKDAYPWRIHFLEDAKVQLTEL